MDIIDEQTDDTTDTVTQIEGEAGTQDSDNATDAATTETEPKVRKDIVPPQYRKLYQELGGNCGDFIAAELTSLITTGGVDSLNAVKTENGIPVARWSSLNNGQQRMNLSNILRAKFLRGETILIGGKQYNVNDMRDEFGGLDVDSDEQMDKFLQFSSMPVTERNRKALVRLYKTLPEQATKRAKREQEAEERKAEKARKAAEKEAEKAAKAETGDKDEAKADKPKRSRKKADAAPAAEGETGDNAE